MPSWNKTAMHRGAPAMRQGHRIGYGNTRIGSRCGCRVGIEKVFRGRKRVLPHQRCNRGGHAGCASRLNVDPAHSLPQQRSAGRNLITVFFTVNCRQATFACVLHARHAAAAGGSTGKPSCRHAMHHRTCREACSKPLEKSTRVIASVHCTARCRTHASFDAEDGAGENFFAHAREFFLAQAHIRTTPELICANIPALAARIGRRAAAAHPQTETAARGGRPASADGVAAISVLRFPATRRKHPGRAGRSTAPARRFPPRTASLRRKHLR